MKSQRFLALFAAAVVLAAASAQAVVGLSVSPASITNDYVGKVTLTITGLSAGQTVRVERFSDLNGNGVVDPATDGLTRSFTVTDGQLPIIGGVRNLNVPGDDDGAVNGTIRVDLDSPGIDNVFGTASGRFIYRVSDPLNVFTPVTRTFTVAQKVYPQGIRGRITAAAGGAPLAGAFVVLLNANGNGIGGASADANGNYSFNTLPGSYQIYPLLPGYIVDGALASATVVTNQFTTNNQALATGAFTISGRLTDATSGAGISGVFMFWQSTNNLASLGGPTDTNGNYSVAVSASQWKAEIGGSDLAQLGYLRPDKLTTNITSASAANVNFAVPKATALIYGTVKDNLNNPVNGVQTYANTQPNLYEASGTSLAPGANYTLGVLAGTWYAGVQSDNLPAGYLAPWGTNVTLTAGQAVQANFVLSRVTAHLRGRVVDQSSNGVAGVSVYASPQNGGNGLNANTAADGSFDLGAAAGMFNLGVSDGDLAARGLIASQLQLTVVDGVDQNNLVLAARTVSRQITGQVTGNGAPLGNVNVFASFTVNGTNFNANASTDGGGQFSLGVFDGTWQVGVSCNGQGGVASLGFTCVNNQTVVLNGANGTANFALTACGALQVTTTSAQLGGGQVGQSYNAQLQASGCGQSFNWSLSPGSGALPPGLNLFGNGNLSGTPTSSGTFNFSVRVTDNTSATADKALSLTITGISTPLQVDTTVLPEAQTGVVYSQQLQASGGQTPYGWSLSPGSLPLPAGLNLAGGGTISGTPTTAGTNYFSVRVTDGAGTTVDQLLSIIVYPMLQMANNALPNGTVGIVYSTQVLVSGGHQFTLNGGPGGYGSFFNSGSLPPGLNFSYGTVTSSNQYFIISGTPTNTGTFSFTMGAYDASNFQVSRSLSITIGASTLQITTASLTNALVGVAASYQLLGSGGTTPYTWTIANGSQPLPSALTLSAGGLISGTPATSGTFSFIVRLTDAATTSVTRSLALTVNSKPRLSSPSRVSGNQFQFTLTGDAGAMYRIEANTNLSNLASWTNLGTNTATGGSFIFTDSAAAGFGKRFYRAVLVP